MMARFSTWPNRELHSKFEITQSKLVHHNRKTLLDAEIAFNESGSAIDSEEDTAQGAGKT
jgi:hypothetical protein